jgi:hypothetical protein
LSRNDVYVLEKERDDSLHSFSSVWRESSSANLRFCKGRMVPVSQDLVEIHWLKESRSDAFGPSDWSGPSTAMVS